MAILVDSIVREAQERIDTERKIVLEASALASNAASIEIRHLQEQNARLVHLLQNERSKADLAKDQLVKRISDLLSDFVSARDRSLRDTFTEISGENEKAEACLSSFADEHLQKMENVVTRGQEWHVNLDKRAGEGKRLRDGTLKASLNLTFQVAFCLTWSVDAEQLEQRVTRRIDKHPELCDHFLVFVLDFSRTANKCTKCSKYRWCALRHGHPQ